MKAKHIICGLATLVLITLTLSNCTKESATSSGLDMKIKATNQTFNIPVQSGGSGVLITTNPYVSLDSAILVVSRVQFEAEMRTNNQVGDTHVVDVSWAGPRIIDLFRMSATLGNIPVPPGNYQEIEFKVYANKSDAGSRPVFYLAGTYSNSAGIRVPLIIDITDDIVINAEKQNVTITVGNTVAISGIIKVYLERLFSSILPQDMNLIAVSQGRIIISATSNTQLYHLILQNLSKDGDFEFGHN